MGLAHRITAGAALEAAERRNALAGHENGGPLSARHGFLPPPRAAVTLPASHAAWDELASALPELHRSLRLRAAMDRMPLLPDGPSVIAGPGISSGRPRSSVCWLTRTTTSSPSHPPQSPACGDLWSRGRRSAAGSAATDAAPDVHRSDRLQLGAAGSTRRPQTRCGSTTCSCWSRPSTPLRSASSYLTQTEILARTAPVIPAAVAAREAGPSGTIPTHGRRARP